MGPIPIVNSLVVGQIDFCVECLRVAIVIAGRRDAADTGFTSLPDVEQ